MMKGSNENRKAPTFQVAFHCDSTAWTPWPNARSHPAEEDMHRWPVTSEAGAVHLKYMRNNTHYSQPLFVSFPQMLKEHTIQSSFNCASLGGAPPMNLLWSYINLLLLSCVRVRGHKSHETSAHKKTWSAHKCSFQWCPCTYFIHIVPSTDESWWNVAQKKFYVHPDFGKN